MADNSFWANWGEALRGLSRNVATQVTTVPLMDLANWHPEVASESLALPEVAITSVPSPQVETRSVRLTKPRCRVTSVPFAEPVLAVRETCADKPSRSVPKRRLKRIAPPEGIPLKDRLQSILQPPISVLLGEGQLWLPFEPFSYQFDGINFLVGRWSALLADEMGLGKTMQTILALRLLLRAGSLRSALLVCPKPLMTNWLREFTLWAEEIPVTPIQGNTRKRRNLWIFDRCPVKIANYESLTRDEPFLEEGSVSFDLVVLDEAQRIKNRESKTARVVHQLRRSRSWALTGTPVENQAGDLVSLLQFVHNRKTDYEDRADLLRDAVAEVLLRRTKELVMNDMPPRLIHDTYIDLGPSQRESYDAIEKDGVLHLNDLGGEVTIEHVFELIRRLKQICNIDPVTGESAKAERLRADLEEIAASGQKAILFSQWVQTIEQLAAGLAEFRPLLYHGKIPQRQRDPILQEFRESKDRPILMMSYGTGAVGLNLQFSNYVFLFDRWWNPAIEDQAINRAHRIGQTQPVVVSRFTTPGTIEERIAEVLQRKRELFSFLIDDHDPLAAGGLTREDIFGLFDLKVRPREENTSPAA